MLRHDLVHFPPPSGVTKVTLNKVKADLESNPKEQYEEEEMEMVSLSVCVCVCVCVCVRACVRACVCGGEE